jgi:hypothetical protein
MIVDVLDERFQAYGGDEAENASAIICPTKGEHSLKRSKRSSSHR